MSPPLYFQVNILYFYLFVICLNINSDIKLIILLTHLLLSSFNFTTSIVLNTHSEILFYEQSRYIPFNLYCLYVYLQVATRYKLLMYKCPSQQVYQSNKVEVSPTSPSKTVQFNGTVLRGTFNSGLFKSSLFSVLVTTKSLLHLTQCLFLNKRSSWKYNKP